MIVEVILPVILTGVVIAGSVLCYDYLLVIPFAFLAVITMLGRTELQFFCLTISILIILYYTLFKKEKNNERKLNSYLARKKEGFAKINKMEQLAVHKRVEKITKFFKFIHFTSDKKIEKMKSDLRIAGIMQPDKYIDNFFKDYILIVVGAGVFVFISFMIRMIRTNNIIIVGTGYLFTIIAALLVLFSIFPFTIFSFLVKDMKAKALKRIEADYPKLFEHIFFYYGTDGKSYLLADVMSKFSANVSFEMSCLIDSLISDCKLSERKALENLKSNYSESTKIVNLSDKLIKCVEGFSLGSETLRGLYDQLIAEEDLLREQREARKNEIYIAVMIVTVSVAFAIELGGILLTMMKETMK